MKDYHVNIFSATKTTDTSPTSLIFRTAPLLAKRRSRPWPRFLRPKPRGSNRLSPKASQFLRPRSGPSFIKHPKCQRDRCVHRRVATVSAFSDRGFFEVATAAPFCRGFVIPAENPTVNQKAIDRGYPGLATATAYLPKSPRQKSAAVATIVMRGGCRTDL